MSREETWEEVADARMAAIVQLKSGIRRVVVEMRGAHQGVEDGYCSWCSQEWPCADSDIADRLEALL
jgi:hypothetical protein